VTAGADLAAAVSNLSVTSRPRIVEVEPDLCAMSRDGPAIYDLRLRAENLRLSTHVDSLIRLNDNSLYHYPNQPERRCCACRCVWETLHSAFCF